ncbi:hypothetical protein [Peribacillus deserti]|uniref:Uncharacterized protein n=1 Tax=Peribacillus deserti TaxID=673318 RepID=A0A2N5M5T8_9BACI|nr:hypothetical protein [Peribacillus deserti]PLT29720.1 hypothetical protein CUU66_11395 [Peribacillus deserti]
MIGLIISIFLLNFLAFKTNKRLTANQIVHIWVFTIAFQQTFDLMIEFKYNGYWYFDKEIDWKGLLPHTVLIPPVNVMFLNWYPFRTKIIKQFTYILIWEVVFLVYETVTLLPEPWGYFNYGWWRLQYAAVINPILLLILLGYYKWVCKLEKKAISR